MPVLVTNQKCDWCQFHWLRGDLDVAMEVIYYKAYLTQPNLSAIATSK